MAKVSIQTIENLQNESAAIGKINSNFAAIQAGIELLLSRDGTSPNQMAAVLDMNNRRILNLPAPISDQEPARHGDIQTYVDQAEAWAVVAEGEADRAESEANEAAAEADEAATHEAAALAHLNNFLTRYLGAYATDPTVNPHTAAALTEGAIYFNTTVNNWRVFNVLTVFVDSDEVMVDADLVFIDIWREFPQSTLRSLSDVEAETIANNQFLTWDTGTATFVPETLTAGIVAVSPTVLGQATVQDALEEIVDQTSLGVYDIPFYIEGLLTDSEIIYRLMTTKGFILPVSSGNAYAAEATVAAAGSYVITMKKNGVSLGTITWSAAATEGVFSIAGATTFNPGDILSLEGASSADTALKNIAIILPASRV